MENLLNACVNNDVDFIKKSIENGVDINTLDDDDWGCPLHWAADCGNLDIINVLIENDADVNIENIFGHTPLYWAAGKGHVDVIEKLIKHGADTYESRHINPLYTACKEGHVAAAKLLSDKMINGSNNILHYACEHGNKEIFDISKYIVDVNSKNVYGETALHIASENGNVEIVKELIELKCDVNMKTSNIDSSQRHCTPLDYAFKYGNKKVADILIKHGADISVKCGPLHYACEGENEEIVEMLLNLGFDVNARNSIRSTPLIMACRGGNVNIIKKLIKYGAEVNVQDIRGNTPLYIVSREGYDEAAKVLIEYGADVNIKNNDGFTPLDIAHEYNNYDVIGILTEHGAEGYEDEHMMVVEI